MTGDWDVYVSSIDGIGALVSVNLQVIKKFPDPRRPIVGRVILDLQEVRESGWATQAESDRIRPIQEALSMDLIRNHGAICAGMFYISGKRKLYYYLPSEDGFFNSVQRVMGQFPTYTFEAAAAEDPEWTEFRDLICPSPLELRSIENGRVVRKMKELGDAVKSPRKVQHWIDFEKEDNYKSFVQAMEKKGFELDDVLHDSQLDQPWRIILSRVDTVEFDVIDKVCCQLLLDAEEFGGTYDGWESVVVEA